MTIHARLKKQEEEAEAELKAALAGEVTAEEAEQLQPEQRHEVQTEDPATEPEEENTIDWELDDNPYKRRYQVLQGKYNAETARYQQRIQELETVEPVTTEPVEDEDEDLFGIEYPEARQKIDRVTRELDELKQNETQRAFLSELSALVPDWESIDKDPDFVGWLQEPDEYLGGIRQDHLNQAASDFNASRIAAFIDAWKATQRKASTPAAPATKYATPSNSASGTPAQGKTYTQAQFDNFYDSVAKGKFRGREVEARQIERELDLAAKEGRILPA